jgi:hypothetical protein
MRARHLTLLTPLLGTAALAAATLGGLLMAAPAQSASRIKDIVDVEGVRTNHLVGYGIVVGLNGTGDTVRNCPMLMQSMESFMERLQVNIREGNLNTKNASAVIVTAELPAFAAPGSPVDISVSAMCDGKSLLGGTSMGTPKSTRLRRAPFRPDPCRPAARPDRRSPRVCRPQDASLRAGSSKRKTFST